MSSGVAWIDRRVGQLKGAREHLISIGLTPRPAGGDRYANRAGGQVYNNYPVSAGWRVMGWEGVFTDDQLVELAIERGFRP